MKKIIIRVVIVFAVLIVVAVIAAALFVDQIIKKSVETVGPMLTKVEVKVGSVNVSMLSGGGKLKGLFVGNPEGFKTPSAIRVGTARLALKPASIFSDKVVIREINVQAPEITFETDLRHNNLGKILANLEEVTGGGGKETPEKTAGGKKLQVDDFLITGGKINVSLTTLAGQSVTVPLPTIHLTQLGTGPEGITSAALIQRVLQEVEKKAVAASADAVDDLGKQAVGKATKTVTDLLKKK